MKTKQRILIAMLLAAMLLSLTACGSSSSSTTEETETTSSTVVSEDVSEAAQGNEASESTETSEPATSAEAAEPVESEVASDDSQSDDGYVSYTLPLAEDNPTITVWTSAWRGYLSSYFESYSDTAFWQELGDQLGVQFAFTTGDMDEQFYLMLAAETPYHIIQGMSLYSGGANQAVLDDILIDLANYEDQMPNYITMLNSDESYLLDAYSEDGILAGFYIFNENVFPQTGLFIRQDYLDGVGITELPKTIDDYHEVLTAFKNEYGGTPFWLGYSGGISGSFFGSAYGVNTAYDIDQGGSAATTMIYVEDGVVKFSPYEEGFKEYLTVMNQWWNEDLIYSDFMVGQNGTRGADQSAVQAGVSVTSRDITQFSELGVWTDGAEWVATYIPVENEGDTLHFLELASSMDIGSGWCIPTNCPDVDLTLTVLDYLYSPEGQMTSTYGFEDGTLIYDADGNPGIDEDLLNNNPDFDSGAAYVNYLGAFSGVSVCDYNLTLETYDPVVQVGVEMWTSNQDDAYVYPTSISLNADEIDTYNQYSGDLFTYVSECMTKFITGDMNLEEDYDTFLETITGLGAETIVSLYQDAYDRYISR